ncbi:hypothetical protein U1Q18_046583 [Sarracenia purpurea var. burkii]
MSIFNHPAAAISPLSNFDYEICRKRTHSVRDQRVVLHNLLPSSLVPDCTSGEIAIEDWLERMKEKIIDGGDGKELGREEKRVPRELTDSHQQLCGMVPM